jgi:hypothetical protein
MRWTLSVCNIILLLLLVPVPLCDFPCCNIWYRRLVADRLIVVGLSVFCFLFPFQSWVNFIFLSLLQVEAPVPDWGAPLIWLYIIIGSTLPS